MADTNKCQKGVLCGEVGFGGLGPGLGSSHKGYSVREGVAPFIWFYCLKVFRSYQVWRCPCVGLAHQHWCEQFMKLLRFQEDG